MGGGGGGGPIGGDLPAGGGSGGADSCVAEVAAATSSVGGRLASLAFSAIRARRASRTRFSSSARRRASVAAVPEGLDDVGEDGGGDVSLRAPVVVVPRGPAPRRPRARDHPPSSLVGEVCVAAVTVGAAAGFVAGCAATSGVTPGVSTRLSPNDFRSAISWWTLPCCLASGCIGRVSFTTEAYERLG